MGDTPLLSSHTHSLCVTAPASSWACLVEQWRETKRLTWVEHGVSAAWGYKRATGFIAIGWGTSRGGSVTQLQHHDTAAQQLSLSHHFSFSHCNSLPVCLSPHCRLMVGGMLVLKQSWHSFYGILQTCHVMETYSISFIFAHTKSTAETVYSPTPPPPCFCSLSLQFTHSHLLLVLLQKIE